MKAKMCQCDAPFRPQCEQTDRTEKWVQHRLANQQTGSSSCPVSDITDQLICTNRENTCRDLCFWCLWMQSTGSTVINDSQSLWVDPWIQSKVTIWKLKMLLINLAFRVVVLELWYQDEFLMQVNQKLTEN